MCSIYVLYMFCICSIYDLYVLYLFYICSISVLYTLYSTYIYIYVYIAHRWSPTPTQSGGAGMTLTPVYYGPVDPYPFGGGPGRPVSSCIHMCIVHPSSIYSKNRSIRIRYVDIYHPSENWDIWIVHPSSIYPNISFSHGGFVPQRSQLGIRTNSRSRPGATPPWSNRYIHVFQCIFNYIIHKNIFHRFWLNYGNSQT